MSVTSTYTVTITTDENIPHDESVRRAVAWLAEDLDPSSLSPVRITVVDADQNPTVAYDYDPDDID
jgi:hypothetical protein